MNIPECLLKDGFDDSGLFYGMPKFSNAIEMLEFAIELAKRDFQDGRKRLFLGSGSLVPKPHDKAKEIYERTGWNLLVLYGYTLNYTHQFSDVYNLVVCELFKVNKNWVVHTVCGYEMPETWKEHYEG